MKTYQELEEALLPFLIKAAARQAFKTAAVKQSVKAVSKVATPKKLKLPSEVTGFQTARGSKYTYKPQPKSWPQTQRTAQKDPYHPTPAGTKQKSDWTLFTTPDASMTMRQRFVSGSKEPFYKGLPQSTQPKVGRAPVEVWNKYAEKGGKEAIHPGSPITDIQTRKAGSSQLPLFGAQRKEIRQRVSTALKKPQNIDALKRELDMIPKPSTTYRNAGVGRKESVREEKTFQDFNESIAAARGALRLLRSASRAGRTVATATGGRRVTSAARAARNVKPSAVMSRAERGEDVHSLASKQELAAKINPRSRFYSPSARTRYTSQLQWDKENTIISGANPRSRNITIARSAAKKAGFKGGGAKNRFDFDDRGKYHTTYPKDKYGDGFTHPKHNTQVDTEINTIASGRKAAAISSGTKRPAPVPKPLGSVSRTPYRVPSTNEIARKMKEFRRRVVTTGGQERNPVHQVDFLPRRDDYGVKGELDKYSMKVGRNFVKAQRNLPKELEKAGAQQGDIVVGVPSHMRKGEDPKLGKEKRAQMYKRAFGNRVTELDPTGRVRHMIGAVGGDVKP
jgi:hypothetical protein